MNIVVTIVMMQTVSNLCFTNLIMSNLCSGELLTGLPSVRYCKCAAETEQNCAKDGSV